MTPDSPAATPPGVTGAVGPGPAVFAAATVAIGGLAFLGWWLDITSFKSLFSDAVSMKANTALAFILAGIALWLLHPGRVGTAARRVGLACAAAVAGLGLLTLTEYLLGVDFAIDNRLIPEPPGAPLTSHPGRMAPGTAMNFCLTGLALLLLGRNGSGRWQPAPYLVLPTFGIAFVALLGYLYDLDALYGPAHFTAMAVHTAAAFFILALGILMARPRWGWMASITAATSGGALLRCLLPAILLLVPLLFYLWMTGERLGLVPARYSLFLMILAIMALLTAAAWWGAIVVDRAEMNWLQAVAAYGQLNTTMQEKAASEARFAGLFQETPVPLCCVDKRGVLTDRNLRFDQTFGYGRDELRTLDDWWRLAYPDPARRAQVLDSWNEVLAESAHRSADLAPREYDITCKDGGVRTMLVSGILLGDDFIAAFFDITERSKATRDLKEARLAALNRMEDANAARRQAETGADRIRLLAEAVERIAAVHDLPSLMAVVRPAVRRLTGADGATLVLNDNGYCFYADEDAIGPLWKGQRFPLESCISGWAMLHGQAAVIEDIYADERIPHEAYRPTFVKSLAMVPIGRSGPVAAIGAYWATRHKPTDEEVELQQALADAMSIGLANIDLIQNLERRVEQRTAELSTVNRELESFAYAVSHDLRAPLRAMSGFSQALQEDFGAQLTGEARVYLEQIGIASRRMGELIEGLLTLSRSTRGELQRDRVDFSALAERRLDELAAAEPGRRVAVSVEDGLVVQGDARMLAAVMTNLVDNAWKYTGKAAAASIRVHAEIRDGRRWYCVADNGAGFDMAHAARLFQPFQRLHRQDEFPGIGIGLVTVQRIIHRHGGEIVAAAAPDQGATFCFTLPEDGLSDKEILP